MVRNKVDADVEAEIEKEEECDDTNGRLDGERANTVEQRTLANIKGYLKSEFDLDGVYCISTKLKLRSRFDFEQLERAMEKTLRQQRGISTK